MTQDSKTPKPTFLVRLLGGFDVRLNDRPLPHLRSRKEHWLLTMLVLRYNRDTSREWLATTLWPDNDEQQALFYLRKSLSNLRKALGVEACRLIAPTPRTVRLDMADAFADVLAFDIAISKSAYQDAIALYSGPLLPECSEDWISVERNQREQAYLNALESLAAQVYSSGDPATAVHWLRRLVSADPYRESACCALMQALADCGDLAAAKAVYQELRLQLRQELNTVPSIETDQHYHRLSHIETVKVSVLPPTTKSATRRHLPVPLSDLVGREDEIVEILNWLKRRRLVTFVGSGGIGKTRLSIAVAEAALERFEHGVWFVDLAAVTDDSRVRDAAAEALGIAEERNRPLMETIVEMLAERSLLLILDNCEHLIDACAVLAHTLLSGCPLLHVLATSRQPLNVMSEQVYRVPSLSVPSTGDTSENAAPDVMEKDPHILMEYESVRLFLDRASRANSAFRLTRRNASAVADICQQLDGIPLAIEMAAARLRSLSVGEISNRLANRFRLLTIGSRGVLPRQQTLRAAVDWSYDLLSEAESALLSALSEFVGGWALEAAEKICGDQSDISDVLSALVDKSLVVRREEADESVRYGMLETIRQYAMERQAATNDGAEVSRRHRDYYLGLAEKAAPKLSGPERALSLSVLDAEHNNLRKAVAFCLADAGSAEQGLRFGAALPAYWRARGHLSEGRTLCAALLAHNGAQNSSRQRADTLIGAGTLAFSQGDFANARAQVGHGLAICRKLEYNAGAANALANLGIVAATQSDYTLAQNLFEESLSIRRSIGDKRGETGCLNGLGNIAQEQGHLEAARALHEENLAIEREIGDEHGIAISLNNLGILADVLGDYTTAQRLFAESLEIHRELGPRTAEAANLAGLGNVAYHQKSYVAASTFYEQSLDIRRQLGESWGIAISLQGLGAAAIMLGNTASARVFNEESLAIRQKLGDKLGIAESFKSFASLALQEYNYEKAANLWGATFALHYTIGSPIPAGELDEMEPEMDAARNAIGETEYAAAWAAGSALTVEQAIEFALNKKPALPQANHD